MEIKLKPAAWVKNSRMTTLDDDWGGIVSEIIYYFDQAKQDKTLYTRRPRGNPDYPEIGIFAQRNKDRPNQIGLSTVELIWNKERSIGVKMLDAIDGTPVLDIKPV